MEIAGNLADEQGMVSAWGQGIPRKVTSQTNCYPVVATSALSALLSSSRAAATNRYSQRIAWHIGS
jgi:hypothetical protein